MATAPINAMICPFFFMKGCAWGGFVTEYFDHLLSTHKDSLKTNPITAELDEGTVHQFLTEVDSALFFIQMSGTSSLTKVKCLVKCLRTYGTDESDTFEYYIELEPKNVPIRLPGKMKKLSDRHQMQYFDFGRQEIPSHQSRSTVKCTVTIYRKPAVDLKRKFQEADTADSETGIHLKLYAPKSLKDAPCPVCRYDASRCIFICSDGHRICRNCIAKANDCSNCHLSASRIQLSSLRLMEEIFHTCKFFKFGCQEARTWNDYEKHINECVYKAIHCPLRTCRKEIKVMNVNDHFVEEHSESLFNDNTEMAIFLFDRHANYYSSVLETDAFVLGFQFERATKLIKFDCIQLARGGIGGDKYVFKLKFLSKTDADLKFSVNHICKTQITEFGNNPLIIIPLKTLEPFILRQPHPILYFTCLIKKV